MNAIRAVLCDFGGVLYKTPDLRWLIRLQRLLGLQIDGTLMALYLTPTQSAYLKAFLCGQITEAEVWNTLIQKYHLPMALVERMRRGSTTAKRLNRPMLEAVLKLRPRFQTAVLTNAGTDFRATFCRAYAMETWADQVIISAEEGLAKPDPALYRLALARMQVEPEEALFIDDVAENVEGARAVGMQAFQFLNNRQALAELSARI